jgi:hypothetical protein
MILTLIPMAYNEESSVVDKWFEISNLEQIRDMVRIILFQALPILYNHLIFLVK